MLTPVASPAGSSGQLQYNAAGAFGGAAALVYAISGTLLTGTAQAATDVVLAVKAHASQSANLQEWQNSSGAAGAKVTSARAFSNTGGQTQSEVYGAGASVSGTDSVAIGYNATVAASSPTGRGVAIGSGATVSGSGAGDSVAIGYTATASGSRFATCIGAASAATTQATAVGYGANASGTASVVIGKDLTCNQNSGVNIGQSNTHTSAVGVVIGSALSASAVADVNIGRSNTITHDGVVCLGMGLTSSRTRELVIGIASQDGVSSHTGGHRVRVAATTSSNALRDLGILDFTWATATDASRTGRLALQVYDSSAAREGLRVEASGTAAMIGFLGASAVVRHATTGTVTGHTGGGGTALTHSDTFTGNSGATAYTIGDIVLALKNYGLLTA